MKHLTRWVVAATFVSLLAAQPRLIVGASTRACLGVNVDVYARLRSHWQFMSSSRDAVTENAFTARFTVPAAAGEGAALNYTARITP